MSKSIPIVEAINFPEHFIAFDTETFGKEENIIKNTKIENSILINKHYLSFGYAKYYELINSEYIVLKNYKFFANGKEYNTDNEGYFYFDKKEDFTNFIINRVYTRQNKPLYIFAHNEAYDFRIIYNEKMFAKDDFKLKVAISDKVFIYKYGKKNYNMIFVSTTNYFKTSLKELGNTFKLQKLDFKIDDDGKKEIIEKSNRALTYCKRDVEAIVKGKELLCCNFLLLL